jgi:hypothetical protein
VIAWGAFAHPLAAKARIGNSRPNRRDDQAIEECELQFSRAELQKSELILVRILLTKVRYRRRIRTPFERSPFMNKFVPLALLATVTLFAAAPATLHAETAAVAVTAGKTLYGPNGGRIASVYRVAADGRVQIILDGKLINVPAASLSEVEGKVTTTLTKSELLRSAR